MGVRDSCATVDLLHRRKSISGGVRYPSARVRKIHLTLRLIQGPSLWPRRCYRRPQLEDGSRTCREKYVPSDGDVAVPSFWLDPTMTAA